MCLLVFIWEYLHVRCTRSHNYIYLAADTTDCTYELNVIGERVRLYADLFACMRLFTFTTIQSGSCALAAFRCLLSIKWHIHERMTLLLLLLLLLPLPLLLLLMFFFPRVVNVHSSNFHHVPFIPTHAPIFKQLQNNKIPFSSGVNIFKNLYSKYLVG